MTDPKIRYDIEADITGAEGADGLAKKLRELGGVLEGDLKRQADDAAASLEGLGAKQGAVSGFAALRREAQQLSRQLDAAASDVDRLSAEMQTAQDRARQFAAAEAAAQNAVTRAKEVLNEQRAALADLRERYTGASQRTDEYREANKQLQVTIRELTRDHKAKEAALREAAQQSAAAAKAERASTKAYEGSVDAARRLSAELGNRNRALSASRDALAGMGVRTDALASADRNLATAVGQVRERVVALAPALAEHAAAVRGGATAADGAGTKLKRLAAESVTTSTHLDGITASLSRLGPMLAGAFGAQQLVGIIAEQQQLALSFEAIFGSAARAAQEMEFVRGAANRLGVESQVLARSYQSLAAATKGTALEGEQTRAVFEATARAMAVLGKSSAQTDQALTAISQMASKGTVSMEELRGQLGEALPGALQATAKGAGITTEQLIGMVESGQVLAKDLLPALTQGLNDLYGKATPPQTIISEWARLKNVITDTATAVGEGGASKGIAKGLAWVALGVRGVSNAADVAGTAIGEFAAAVRTGNFDLQQAAALNAKYDAELRKAAEDAGLIEKAQTAATQATQAQVRAIDNAVAAQQRQATSTLAVRAAYAELAKGSKEYSDLAAKVVSTRQAEAGLLTGLVGVYGTEQERRQAAAEAAGMQARSLKDLADARNVEAVVAQSYSLKLQEEALKRNDNSKATQDEIKAARLSADAKRAEADQAAATARSKSVEVAAAQAAAAAYEDNASKVYQLRGAATEAAREVERLVALEKQGKATSDQVTDARVQASKAMALYRDALSDASAAAEREMESARRTAQVVQGAISVDLERANAMKEVAEAAGDVAGAEAARQAATTSQIRAAQQSAQAARDEAAALRTVADAKEAELRATGQLTAEKRAEIDAMRRSADLKDQEAQKADILAGKLNALANSEQARTDALERHISAQEKALELEERRLALENKRLGRDKAGFSTDKLGQTINAGGATLTSVFEFLRGAGVQDDATARRIAREFADSRGNIQFFNNPGQKKYGGSTLSDALLKAAERVTFAGSGAAKSIEDAAAQRTSAQTVKVDINLNGSSQGSVATNREGAAVLRAVLGQLQEAKSRSSAR